MKDVEAKFTQLKPVLGGKIYPLWLAYSLGNRNEKEELEGLVDVFRYRLLRESFNANNILLDPPQAKLAYGPYLLGQVCYGVDKSRYPVGLRENEWIQHLGIFGRSGAGKTNLVFLLIWNLFKKKKPFLIFDWKRNYRDLLRFNKNLQIYTVGRNIAPFHFNPLIPPKGTHPKVWLKKLIEVISHAYFTGEGVQHIFQKCIDQVYKNFGVYAPSKAAFPTFNDVYDHFSSTKSKGYRQSLWMDSTMRVLSSLTFGSMGSVINSQNPNNIYQLLKQNVILELDSLSEADKTFFIEALLLWIHQYRLQEGGREKFKHCTIIEEAHHILLKKKQEQLGGETITDLIVREIRELGEAIVIVDQHPSLISLPALGNTNATITFYLKHQADVNTAANSMLVEEEHKHFIGELPVGHAIVKLQSRYPKPFLVKVPQAKLIKGSIQNQDIAAHMKAYSASSGRNKPCLGEKQRKIQIPLSDKVTEEAEEITLLRDIHQKPFSSIVKRYQRLNISGRQGNKFQLLLIKQGFIEPVNISTKRGRLGWMAKYLLFAPISMVYEVIDQIFDTVLKDQELCRKNQGAWQAVFDAVCERPEIGERYQDKLAEKAASPLQKVFSDLMETKKDGFKAIGHPEARDWIRDTIFAEVKNVIKLEGNQKRIMVGLNYKILDLVTWPEIESDLLGGLVEAINNQNIMLEEISRFLQYLSGFISSNPVGHTALLREATARWLEELPSGQSPFGGQNSPFSTFRVITTGHDHVFAALVLFVLKMCEHDVDDIDSVREISAKWMCANYVHSPIKAAGLIVSLAIILGVGFEVLSDSELEGVVLLTLHRTLLEREPETQSRPASLAVMSEIAWLLDRTCKGPKSLRQCKNMDRLRIVLRILKRSIPDFAVHGNADVRAATARVLANWRNSNIEWPSSLDMLLENLRQDSRARVRSELRNLDTQSNT